MTEAQTLKAETDLIKSIDELKESYRIEDIEQLVIEDVHLVNISEKLKTKLEELLHLESLALNRCKLTSLDNLPVLPNLIQISLDNNFITGDELKKLHLYQKLISLSILDNQIDNINDFDDLKCFDKLLQLNIYKNPISNQLKVESFAQKKNQIRQSIFEKLPQLLLLDNLNKEGSEVSLEGEAQIFEKQQKTKKPEVNNNTTNNQKPRRGRKAKKRDIVSDSEDDGAVEEDSTSDFDEKQEKPKRRKRVKH